MKISSIECFVLGIPECNPNACDSAQDTIVIQIHTDEGLTGIGEVDTNPYVAKALIEAPGSHIMALGLTELLMGKDPTQPRALWERLYTYSAMTGRRGAGVCAMGALDIALWDIWGKAEGKPIWRLLGGAKQGSIRPYASLLPMGTPSRNTARVCLPRSNGRGEPVSQRRSWKFASKVRTHTTACARATTPLSNSSRPAARKEVPTCGSWWMWLTAGLAGMKP